MTTQRPVIKADKRDRIGSRYARRLRSTGRLPAVMYGHKQEPVAISVDHKELIGHLQHGVRLFDIDVEGKSETCLVKDLQFGFLGDNVIHMDLSRVDLTEEVTVHASLNFMGTAIGLKTTGAIFRAVVDNVEVRCAAQNIPSEGIDVDVSELEAGDHLSASQITMPAGIELEADPEMIICRIAVVAEEPEEPVADEEGAEPEIITEKAEKSEEGGESSSE